jgi:hypothetical protein
MPNGGGGTDQMEGVPRMYFEQSYVDGKTVAKPIGRLYLGDNSVVRVMLMPDGLHIMVKKGSKFVHEVEFDPSAGLGPLEL